MSQPHDRVTQGEVDAVSLALRAEGVDPATAHRGQIRKAGNVGDRRARTIQTWIKLTARNVDSNGFVPISQSPIVDSTTDRTLRVTVNNLEDQLVRTKRDNARLTQKLSEVSGLN